MSGPRPAIVNALGIGLMVFVTIWLVVGFEAAAVVGCIAIIAIEVIGRIQNP